MFYFISIEILYEIYVEIAESDLYATHTNFERNLLRNVYSKHAHCVEDDTNATPQFACSHCSYGGNNAWCSGVIVIIVINILYKY